MAKLKITHRVSAPTDEVWESWNDFGGNYKFNPNLSYSHLLDGSTETGLGATRKCNMKDGRNWVSEEVINYVSGKSMTIKVTGGTMPLKEMVGTISVHKINNSLTEVALNMTFIPKDGFMGILMMPMMKIMFKRMLKKVFVANEKYVLYGTTVNI